MRIVVLSLLSVFLLSHISLSAQSPELDLSKCEHSQWSVDVKLPTDIKKGNKLSISFDGTIVDKGWHIYSSQESPNGFGYQPTSFTLNEENSHNIKQSEPMTESLVPHSYYDDLMQDTIRMFEENQITFTQEFEISGKNPVINGDFSFQLCKQACIFVVLPFEYKISPE